jgi:hypothetical protein
VSPRFVTIIAHDERSRNDVAHYLQRSGFDVSARDQTARGAAAARSLVWLTDRGGDTSRTATAIGAWLAAEDERCAVVVTWQPSAFRAVLARHGERIAVLPAPVFGWQIVDALRAAAVCGPPVHR